MLIHLALVYLNQVVPATKIQFSRTSIGAFTGLEQRGFCPKIKANVRQFRFGGNFIQICQAEDGGFRRPTCREFRIKPRAYRGDFITWVITMSIFVTGGLVLGVMAFGSLVGAVALFLEIFEG